MRSRGFLRGMLRDGSGQTVAAKLPFYGGFWPFGLGLGSAVKWRFRAIFGRFSVVLAPFGRVFGHKPADRPGVWNVGLPACCPFVDTSLYGDRNR
jgi:hypothetical protein